MYMFRVKCWRCVRRAPRFWWAAFKAPVASAGQLFQALVAYLVLVLLLRSATPVQRDMLASDWAIWVTALGIAILIWFAITILWSPYAVILSEKRLGKWHGRCFVYREPHLVATIRCHAGSKDQQHAFKFDDPEVGSMLHCSVELYPPVGRTVTPQVFTTIRTARPPQPGSWSSFRLEKDRKAHIYFHTSGPTGEYTARVYCHQFEMYRAGEIPGTF
jgi:hypothetical protein